MGSAKDKHGVREGFFTREEWPFPDKGILINHHFVYLYIYISISHTQIYIYIHMHTHTLGIIWFCPLVPAGKVLNCAGLCGRGAVLFSPRDRLFLWHFLWHQTASNRLKPVRQELRLKWNLQNLFGVRRAEVPLVTSF